MEEAMAAMHPQRRGTRDGLIIMLTFFWRRAKRASLQRGKRTAGPLKSGPTSRIIGPSLLLRCFMVRAGCPRNGRVVAMLYAIGSHGKRALLKKPNIRTASLWSPLPDL